MAMRSNRIVMFVNVISNTVKKKSLKIDCRPQATELTVDFIGLRPTKISQSDSFTRGQAPQRFLSLNAEL